MRPLFIILFFLPLSAFSQSYQIGDKLNVNARSGLNVRDVANLNSNKVGFLEYGQKVEVLSKGLEHEKLVIENLEGSWVLIQSGKTKGFVFDGFLTKLPVVDLRSRNEYWDNCIFNEMEDYAFQKLKVIQKTKYEDGSDHENSFRHEIFDLKNNHQFIKSAYHEALGHEIQLENIRRSEGIILIKSFFQNCNLLSDEIEEKIEKEGYQTLFEKDTTGKIKLIWYQNRMWFEMLNAV